MDILVVEDDRDIRELVCQSLEQNDFRTVGCRDVQEAKQSLAELNPDCLVVDWMLPDGSGVELIRWMRHQHQYQRYVCHSTTPGNCGLHRRTLRIAIAFFDSINRCVNNSQHFFICISVIPA